MGAPNRIGVCNEKHICQDSLIEKKIAFGISGVG